MTTRMVDRVRARMKALGINASQLAGKIDGMSESALSQFLNEKTRNVRPENLVDMAQALETSVEWLVRGHTGYAARMPPEALTVQEPRTPFGTPEMQGKPESKRRMVHAWNDLVEFQRQDLLKRAEEHAKLNREIRDNTGT